MTEKLPMSMLVTKSIEQRQLEAMERIVVQLDEILAAGAKLWPKLFDKEETLVQAARKERRRK